MYKFFVNDNQIINKEIIILGSDINHIKNVLRLESGNEIIICNRVTSKSFLCIIKDINTECIKCAIKEEILESTETKTYIHIFQGLPKADKFEWIIEKCTEIGVKEITPVIMKRTIVKLDEKDKVKKINRWKKIAEVSAKQSKRDTILKINEIVDLKDIFKKIKNYDIVLVAYENEKENTLKKMLCKLDNISTKIAVIIGPEGGIDEQEIELCKSNNAIPVTLGKRILRTETAPIVIASNILYELEN